MTQDANITADLFVTCIIDQLYPEVGVSVVKVLRRLGGSLYTDRTPSKEGPRTPAAGPRIEVDSERHVDAVRVQRLIEGESDLGRNLSQFVEFDFTRRRVDRRWL